MRTNRVIQKLFTNVKQDGRFLRDFCDFSGTSVLRTHQILTHYESDQSDIIRAMKIAEKSANRRNGSYNDMLALVYALAQAKTEQQIVSAQTAQ